MAALRRKLLQILKAPMGFRSGLGQHKFTVYDADTYTASGEEK